MSRRHLVAIVLVGVTVCGLAGGAAAAPAAWPIAVTGYQQEGDPTAAVDRSRHALTTVGVDGVTLTSSGGAITAVDADARAQLTRVRHDHLRAELLVSNFSDGIDDFDEGIAHALLASAAHRHHVVAQLVALVGPGRWSGIHVDLESLSPRDTAGLTAFLQELHAGLRHRGSLAIALQSAGSAAGYRALGYDLPAIARATDRVALMAYDEHGPWENTPGPIGALAWVRSGVRVLLHSVPADRVDLGIAEYGYGWRPHSNDTYSVRQARTVAGTRARFDRSAGEWTASLADGSTLWWSDSRSYRLRVALARSLHLHGVAVWALGLGDPLS